MIEWGPQYMLGIAKVDQQHMVLVTLINRLESLRAGDAPSDRDLDEILKHLEQYVHTHFRDEEALLERLAYPEFPGHREEHHAFENRVAAFREAFANGDASVPEKLGQFLEGWLLHHILENDRKYVEDFRARDVLSQA